MVPLYEYACPTCKSAFEKLRPMSEGAEAHCPTCGAVSRRLVSLFAAPVHVGAGASSAVDMPVSNSCCGGACGCA